MAGPLDALVAAVAAEDTVIQGAITFINGVPALITAAVTAALAGGATPAQLAPLTGLVTDLQNQTAAITAALTANTPPAPVVPPAPAPAQKKKP
jgi:hypothetical protein